MASEYTASSFIDLSGSMNTSMSRLPNLEEAYTRLMTSRDDNLYISPDEGGLTEEDILCNSNLRTAKLFRGYTEEHKKLQEDYKLLTSDEEQITRANDEMYLSIKSMRSQTQKHHAASTDSIERTILLMNRSMGTVVLSIMNEIQLKKSSLEAKIDKLTKKLSTLRSLIQTGLEEMVDKDSANNLKLCAICFDREVDMVMVPCGHTSCSGCSNYNSLNKCMHCRGTIQKRVKIFFST
jgi:hypothetical protein